jgi:hypothetical protein
MRRKDHPPIALRLEVVPVELLIRDGKRAQTTGGVTLDVVLELGLEFLSAVARAELDDGSGHALGDALEFA